MHRATDRHGSCGDLASYLASLDIDRDWQWAYANFEQVLAGLIRQFHAKDVCELGGGRRPFFSRQRASELNIRYVVNDIDSGELHRAPEQFDTARFDLTAMALPDQFQAQFDLVFSHMLMEHVSDGRKAYENIFKILRPGGVFINFHPVLYSPVLMMNWIMPDKISSVILRFFQPHRHVDDSPKFPAKYSYCVVNRKTRDMLYSVGFQEVIILPFYGHNYFNRIPPLQSVDDALTRLARRRGFDRLATLCYAVGRK